MLDFEIVIVFNCIMAYFFKQMHASFYFIIFQQQRDPLRAITKFSTRTKCWHLHRIEHRASSIEHRATTTGTN